MNTAAAKTVYTPEDLLAKADGKDDGPVDGRLVERNLSTLSSWLAGRLFRYLDQFVEEHRLGWAFPEGTGFRCFFATLGKVRKADASFVRREWLPADAAIFPPWAEAVRP